MWLAGQTRWWASVRVDDDWEAAVIVFCAPSAQTSGVHAALRGITAKRAAPSPGALGVTIIALPRLTAPGGAKGAGGKDRQSPQATRFQRNHTYIKATYAPRKECRRGRRRQGRLRSLEAA